MPPAAARQPRLCGFRGRWGGDLVYSPRRVWLSAGHGDGTDMGGVVVARVSECHFS